MLRRVVVTGLGTVNPMGGGVEPSWKAVLEGRSGASSVTKCDVSDLASRIACQVPRGTDTPAAFDADRVMEPKEQRKFDEFIVFAAAAADEAIADAGWSPDDEEALNRTGVLIGSGIGGLVSIERSRKSWKRRGRGACRRSSSRARSSTWHRASFPSATAFGARTTPL